MSDLTHADLRAGDVLLYRSGSWISQLICSLDGAEVSHAGLYLGNGLVGEALIVANPGLHPNPVDMSFSGSDWVAVRRLHDVELSTEPVLMRANTYLAPSDEELDEAIQEYLGAKQAMRASASGPTEATREDVEEAAASLVQELGSYAFGGTQAMVLGAGADNAAEKAAAVFADFVTPDDLYRSPSLASVGRVVSA